MAYDNARVGSEDRTRVVVREGYEVAEAWYTRIDGNPGLQIPGPTLLPIIRPGFLDSESRRDLIDLARDGAVAHWLARRANALVLLDDGLRSRDWRPSTRRVAASLRPDAGNAGLANRKPLPFLALPSSAVNHGGKFLLKRKSRSDRVQARLAEVKEELRHRRLQPIPEQGKWLAQVVAGFFNYHAVPTNFAALQAFRDHVRDLWRRSLRRRSQRDNTTYERMKKLANDWLASPSDTQGGSRMRNVASVVMWCRARKALQHNVLRLLNAT